MKENIAGVLILLLSAFLFHFVAGNKLEGVIFLTGFFYGVVVIFHNQIERALFAKLQRPLLVYGFLVFLAGMLIELAAYTSNLTRIRAGEPVYLFSPNLFLDLFIGLPHYIALGLVWAWLVGRYKISALEQAVLLGLFWGIVVDNFSHFLALLSGNILDFVISGLVMVFALNWPLVLMQNKIDEAYPNRNFRWTKYPVAFVGQILPMIVLIVSGLTLKRWA